MSQNKYNATKTSQKTNINRPSRRTSGSQKRW